VFEARLGPAVTAALESGYELLVGEDVADLADGLGVELADYFEPSP
jgi:tRNA nucleotidyltransferase (CCA-adding enzyme)